MNDDRQHPPRSDTGFDHDFDRALRARHREAVASLSPRVQAQLQQRLRALRPPGMRRRHPAWGLAAACSLALVLAFGVHRRIADGNSPVFASNPTAGNSDSGELVATLDEAPDLYVWLASDDANHILSE